jgi:hypothetical protein
MYTGSNAEQNDEGPCAGAMGEGIEMRRAELGRGHISHTPNSLLSPIDDNAARSCRCDANGTLCLAAQPLESALVIAKETLERDKTLAIVLAHPVLFLFAEHVFQHHASLDGYTCQAFETEPALVWVRVFGVHVANDEYGFDPDAEFVLLICFTLCQKNSGTR